MLVNIHVPFYSSYADQFKVNEAMRTNYEPLFLQHSVDIVLSGHVHSYERTKPVYNYTVDECGPVHLIVGDGGNLEGMAATFIDEKPPEYCQNTTLYPNMFVANPDGKCPGLASTLHNATHALWEWHKNQVEDSEVSDSVTLVRGNDSQACTDARAATGAAASSG
ncbi:hypothetical protein ABPG75_004178 [Micractinium tetrahymenae]